MDDPIQQAPGQQAPEPPPSSDGPTAGPADTLIVFVDESTQHPFDLPPSPEPADDPPEPLVSYLDELGCWLRWLLLAGTDPTNESPTVRASIVEAAAPLATSWPNRINGDWYEDLDIRMIIEGLVLVDGVIRRVMRRGGFHRMSRFALDGSGVRFYWWYDPRTRGRLFLDDEDLTGLDSALRSTATGLDAVRGRVEPDVPDGVIETVRWLRDAIRAEQQDRSAAVPTPEADAPSKDDRPWTVGSRRGLNAMLDVTETHPDHLERLQRSGAIELERRERLFAIRPVENHARYAEIAAKLAGR